MKRDADTASLVSPRVLQRDLVCEPMADVNMPPEGEGSSSSYAPTDVALPTPGSVSDAIGSREFSIVSTLRTMGYRQRTVHSVVFKMVEIGAESDRELVVCEVNDEGRETYKTLHYHFYGILGNVRGLENAWTEAQQVANYWRSHFAVPIRAIDATEQVTTAASPSMVDQPHPQVVALAALLHEVLRQDPAAEERLNRLGTGNDGVSLADLARHIAIVAADLERRDDLPGSC